MSAELDPFAEFFGFVRSRFHYDFTGYAQSSLRRRASRVAGRHGCDDLAALQALLTARPELFTGVVSELTVPVSEMFRDPPFFRELRERVLPYLATFPLVRVWIAGCSTGEELYSVAIVLREQNLLERSLIYATDINPRALQAAEAGIYDVGRMAAFTRQHQRSGAKTSLSDHYHADEHAAVFDRTLRERVVFSDHSLATDGVFAEVQLVVCRNVLIYFGRELQDRALGLFADALCPLGFLGLGPRETLQFSPHRAAFRLIDEETRWYQRT